MEYQKIDTIFMRDANNIIIPSKYTKEEFKYLENCIFECTEKIDGTNIRIELTINENRDFIVEFKGRTDNASIPKHLLDRLYQIFGSVQWGDVFLNVEPNTHITIYGEGYGAKIQKGGNYIKDGCDFILFDVKVGKWWLSRANCEGLANTLGIKIVPLIGYMTLKEAIEFVKKGFKSTIAQNTQYDAEGLVCKTPQGLLFRSGDRIVTKIKTCDFVKFKNKYGEEENPVQPVNPKYQS